MQSKLMKRTKDTTVNSKGKFHKKKLSDRMYKLTDGTLVQRDWYSSFLLYFYDYRTKDIDKTNVFPNLISVTTKKKP